MQDILESDDEELAPGPGHYHDGQKSAFRPETKPQRLQFFGSTVERFTDTNRFKKNDDIGPGSYQFAGNTFTTKAVKPNHRKSANIGFSAKEERFADAKTSKKISEQVMMITPGPGHYDDNKTIS